MAARSQTKLLLELPKGPEEELKEARMRGRHYGAVGLPPLGLFHRFPSVFRARVRRRHSKSGSFRCVWRRGSAAAAARAIPGGERAARGLLRALRGPWTRRVGAWAERVSTVSKGFQRFLKGFQRFSMKIVVLRCLEVFSNSFSLLRLSF